MIDDKWNLQNMPDNLVHGQWQVVPIVSTGDTEVRVRWEDEGGKIRIDKVAKVGDVHDWLVQLFADLEIDQGLLDIMADPDHQNFQLLSELHHIMGDEDFRKVERFLTVYSALDRQVNINTAPDEVLRSVFGSQGMSEKDELIEEIVTRREKEPFQKGDDLKAVNDSAPTQFFDFKNWRYSRVSMIRSFATVGEYTKQVDAVIRWNESTFDILYWRVL